MGNNRYRPTLASVAAKLAVLTAFAFVVWFIATVGEWAQ